MTDFTIGEYYHFSSIYGGSAVVKVVAVDGNIITFRRQDGSHITVKLELFNRLRVERVSFLNNILSDSQN